MEPPAYGGSGAGYGYDAEKTEVLEGVPWEGEHSPPAHEIRLEDMDEGIEMVQKTKEPLLGFGQERGRGRRGTDASMKDVGGIVDEGFGDGIDDKGKGV